MRKTPSMNSLRVFEAAARLLSFKAAADELCVTPAAVSNQIQKLEQFLGVRLFKRFNRRIELTDAGTKYLVRMRLIFDDIENATRDIMQKGDTHVVSLAVPAMLLKNWIIPNLEDFYASFPEINLRLIDTLRYIHFEKEEIDLAIRYGLGEWPGMTETLLFVEELCPVYSPALLKQGQTLEKPADLVHFRLIYTERRLIQWDNYLAAGGYEKLPIKEKIWFLNSIHTLEAVLQGIGIALINKKLAARHIENGELLIPFEINLQSGRTPGYYLIYPDNKALSAPALSLAQWLSDLAQKKPV